MNEQERAEEHLRTIRRLMERGTIYRAISAPTALVGGVLSLIAGGLVAGGFGRTHSGWFIPLWLVVLLLTVAANSLFLAQGALKRGENVFSPSMRAACVALAPAFLVGAIHTLLFMDSTSGPDDRLIISCYWAIFYGLGLLATSHFAPRSLVILGWAFLCSGLGALLFLRLTFPLFNGIEMAARIFMAATFGLYHLVYALCAWPRKGAELEP